MILFLVYCYMLKFRFKLLSILILESIFSVVILIYFFEFLKSGLITLFIMVLFSIFLVLDSCLSLSNLIFSSRNSSMFSSSFLHF